MSTKSEIIELKQRVIKLERQITYLMKHLRLNYCEKPEEAIYPEILELIRKGKKIRAIKLYREETGVGLKEAKEYVESLEM